MSMLRTPGFRYRELHEGDVKRELEELAAEVGSYESLARKADAETLSAAERAVLRRMENLRFLQRSA